MAVAPGPSGSLGLAVSGCVTSRKLRSQVLWVPQGMRRAGTAPLLLRGGGERRCPHRWARQGAGNTVSVCPKLQGQGCWLCAGELFGEAGTREMFATMAAVPVSPSAKCAWCQGPVLVCGVLSLPSWWRWWWH